MTDGKENEIQRRKGKRIGAYFSIDPVFGSGSHGLEMENEEKFIVPPCIMICPPDGKDFGFPVFSEAPIFRPNKKYYKRPPKDFELFLSWWIVSSRVKAVLERIDPDSVSLVECEVFHPSGKPVEPKHYLCDVIREVDALDADRSNLIHRLADGRDYYLFPVDPQISFKSESLNGAHIFRQKKVGGIFCDTVLREALNDAGVKNTNIIQDVSIRL